MGMDLFDMLAVLLRSAYVTMYAVLAITRFRAIATRATRSIAKLLYLQFYLFSAPREMMVVETL